MSMFIPSVQRRLCAPRQIIGRQLLLTSTRPARPVSRNLASSSVTTEPKKPLHLFVIWAPDYTDDDAINRRLAVRSSHLATAKENMKAGYITSVNGPLLSPESIASPDAPRKMIGSMLIVRGTSLEEVRAKVESDVYWTGNVWDKEKLVVLPYLTPSVFVEDNPSGSMPP